MNSGRWSGDGYVDTLRTAAFCGELRCLSNRAAGEGVPRGRRSAQMSTSSAPMKSVLLVANAARNGSPEPELVTRAWQRDRSMRSTSTSVRCFRGGFLSTPSLARKKRCLNSSGSAPCQAWRLAPTYASLPHRWPSFAERTCREGKHATGDLGRKPPGPARA